MKAINLISPEIKAQEACKKAILEIIDHVLPNYEKSVSDGLIESFSISLEVWNRGYQFKIIPKSDIKLRAEMEQNGKSTTILETLTVSIQPSSFFNSEFLKGDSSIETFVSYDWKSNHNRQSIKEKIFVDTQLIKSIIDNLLSVELSAVSSRFMITNS